MQAIRQQIAIEASSRAVWNALTTEEGLRSWWSADGRVDAREGGRIVIHEEVDGEPVEVRGMFLSVRPTRTIEIRFDDVGKGISRGTRLQFQVGRGAGETKLHVVQTLGAGLEDEEARAAQDAFWKDALLSLREKLEG